ncbi:MAG TPA: non-homologous end-joining DNA ligase [Kofleriaceae bacterium]|nr:non-homologous end-joining DNA ligase [Kofleriaceae bacterium]
MARHATSAKLAKYRSMRDFTRTAEPSGDSLTGHPGHSYVIQQHAARRLHYDFRLELDGVLLSWSVPKGPSLSPADRRLAVRTEDHPLDYASFEGVIPQGQYGGGTVVVWDRGTWEPEGDAHEALARGRLTFHLRGEKLRGRWHLVRTRSETKAENWLLFKGRDDAANDQIDIVSAQPASVLSGRTLDEIAAAPERVWASDEAAALPGAPPGGGRPARRSQAANVNRPVSLVEQLPLGFKLTNLDKVLFPDGRHGAPGITKGDLIAYLAVVSEWALPHVADRPLTIVRCPEGLRPRTPRARVCFFQKHLLAGSPPSIDVVPVTEVDGESVDYMRVHDMAGMVALAQLGTLEIHTWGAHADKIEKPDLMVFDLDPDIGLGWEQVVLGALELRRRLHELGLESFVKTTGGKGLHVVAPVTRGIGWDDLKAFTKAVVESMAGDEPSLYTTNMAKAHRKGKVFLDYLRNGRGATFIAPYSPRARSGAPVAVPVTWEELAHGVDPGGFTIHTVPRRLAIQRNDPWRAIHDVRQSITAGAWRAVGGKPRGKPGG